MKKFLIRASLGLAVFVVLLVAVYYLGDTWFLMKYGATSQPVPEKILNVDQGFTFPEGFPPDPGKEGKKTIEGIDSDRDGVRDDVQRWIYAFVPDDREKQMALRQDARSLQEELSNEFESLDYCKRTLIEIDRAIQCMSRVFVDELHGHVEGEYLQAKVLNTYSRTKRFWENQRYVTTEEMAVEQLDYEEPCDHR